MFDSTLFIRFGFSRVSEICLLLKNYSECQLPIYFVRTNYVVVNYFIILHKKGVSFFYCKFTISI